MPNSERNSKTLKDINDELAYIREQAFQDTKKFGSRTRKVGGKEQKFSQSTLLDEIDRFNTVSAKIKSGAVVDFSINDALETVQLVASQLENPDLTSTERKGLKSHLDVAEKQLTMGTDAGLDAAGQKDYKKAIDAVRAEIANFRDITDKGTRSLDTTKEFIAKQKDDAMGAMIGVLTRNPVMMMAYNMFSDYRSIKKKNQAEADNRLMETRRARISELEAQKTNLEEMGVKPAEADDILDESPTVEGQSTIEELAQKAYDESRGQSPTPEPEYIPKTESPTVSQPTNAGTPSTGDIIHEDLQEVIAISKKQYELFADMAGIQEDAFKLAEKQGLHAEENRREANRNKGGTILGGVKDKMDDMKKSILAGIMKFRGMIVMAVAAFSFLLQIMPQIIAVGKIFLRFLGPLAAIGASLYAGFKAFDAWGESEGKPLAERISDTARAYGDALLGLVGTSGEEISTAILDVFEGIAKWWNDFDIIDQIKKMMGFGGKTKEQKIASSQSSSEAAKEAFSTGNWAGWGNSINVEDPELLKAVDTEYLLDILKSPDSTDDTKKKITEELISRGEPVVVGAKMSPDAVSISPVPEANVNRAMGQVNDVAAAVVEQNRSSTTETNNGPVIINNNTTNTSSTVSTKSMPSTSPMWDSARMEGGYA